MPWRGHLNGVACHGIAVDYHCNGMATHGDTMTPHGNVMAAPCKRHGKAMAGLGVAMALFEVCQGITCREYQMALPWISMVPPWYCHEAL